MPGGALGVLFEFIVLYYSISKRLNNEKYGLSSS